MCIADKIYQNYVSGQIFITDSGKHSISLFKKYSFDIVFLDILMPDMDGKVVLEKMKKIKPDVSIVFLSGQLNIKADELKTPGAFAFIRKPFDINQILKILNSITNK